jgi:hypothetical protein
MIKFKLLLKRHQFLHQFFIFLKMFNDHFDVAHAWGKPELCFLQRGIRIFRAEIKFLNHQAIIKRAGRHLDAGISGFNDILQNNPF